MLEGTELETARATERFRQAKLVEDFYQKQKLVQQVELLAEKWAIEQTRYPVQWKFCYDGNYVRCYVPGPFQEYETAPSDQYFSLVDIIDHLG